MKCVARVVASLSFLIPAYAFGLAPTESPYLGLAASYAFTDEDGRPTPVDDGGGVQLLFGWPSAGRWTFELSLVHHELDAEVSGVDAKRTALGLDGVFFFNPHGPSVYLLAGLGAVRNDLDPVDEDTDVFANAGIGLISGPLTERGLRLRGDVRYVADNYHDNPDDVHVNLGLMWPLRRAEPKRVVERTEIEVPPPPPPPRDSDGDGVMDSIDRCPDTLPGTEVDRYGCAKKKAVVVLRDVHFEFDSAELTSDSRKLLQRAAQAMRGQPTMQVEIAGHTDHIGSDAYNQRLSEQRALSVLNFLVQSGIARSRLSAVGYGERQPIAPNTNRDGSDNPEGRAQNRRVEFKVLYR